MKVTLLDIITKNNKCVNKDVMSGFGTVTEIGNSFLAKIIERQKMKGVRLPILSLGYIAAILSKNGHEVIYSKNKIPTDSDLIIIQSSIVEYKAEIEAAKRIKELSPKTKVCFIGPFATFKSEIYSKYADLIIKNEPEEVILKIKEDIPNGIVTSKQLDDLDSLPYPKWEIFPIHEYSYYPVIKKKPFLPVLSSRSCTYSCNYCPYPAYYGKWRQRKVENIVNEIDNLIAKFKVKGIFFRDPIFSVNRKRAYNIADEMIKRKVNIEWGCETRLDALDIPLVKHLYDSGLRSINVGIESSDEDVIKDVNRVVIAKKHQEEIIGYCDKIGVKVTAFYILGLPEDSIESVEKTIKYAKKLNTHVAQFTLPTPYPGTALYEQLKDKLLTTDWERFNSYTPVVKHDRISPEQLSKLKEKAFVTYYFRPSYLFKFAKRMLLT